MDRPPELRARELCLLVLALALLLFVSPLRLLWARDESHWLLPFALWFGVLALGGIAARRRGDP